MRRAGTGKFALLWSVTLLFALSDRASGDTFGGHLAAALSNQYYCVFAVLPVCLLIFGGLMEDDPEPVLLRHGTYFRYFLRKWLSECLLAVPLWAGQLAALALSGVGLPSGGWGRRTDVLCLLAGVFPGPAGAFVCGAIHLLLGYWLMALLTLWLGRFLSKVGAVGALAGLYVLTVFQMKLPVFSRPPLVYLTGLSHWVLMLHNLTEPWRLPLTLAVTAIFAAVALVSTRFFWRKKYLPSKNRPRGLGAYYRRVLFSGKNALFLPGLSLLLAVWTFLRSGGLASGRDWTVSLMAGQGTGSFYFPGMLSQLVSQLLPLWPLAALVSEAVGGRSAMLAARLSRKRELTQALLGTALAWLALWLTLTLCALLLPPLLAGREPDMVLLLTSLALRGLDIAFQFLLLMLFMALTGSVAAGFISLTAAHLMCALPLPYWPVGLSCLARLYMTGGAVSVGAAASELFTCCIVLSLWLYFRGSKFLFERCGGKI